MRPTVAMWLFTLLLAAVAASAADAPGQTVARGSLGSDHFEAGGSVNLTEPVAGDAFLAGGRIATAADVQGDLIAGGGDLSIGGRVGDDLYAAGGDVLLDAVIVGNARIAGGDVAVGPATVVEGALTLGGGRIRFEGETRKGLKARGAQVTLDGVVQGDADVAAEEVIVGPHTRITGKLIVHASRAPAVPAGAVIAGGVEFHAADASGFSDEEGAPRADPVGKATHFIGSLLWIIGVFIAGTLFTLALPAYSARAADSIGREPLRSLGLGFVIFVCVPILALLLLLTIFGIPLALILLLLYLLLLFLGWVTAALFIGRRTLALFGRAQAPSLAARLGTL
ncbi:MAG: hypothetical protein ACR2I8_03745, partial [Steroidobacteraceae bacterium]